MEERTYPIGDWTFAPAANELRRGVERRRLEDRAARTLELLCTHLGEPVAQDRIIAAVWNGRSQSANSVPVVIGDLRRALGDDARQPRYIETVTKRGYRLIAAGQPMSVVPVTGRRWPAIAVVGVILMASLAWVLRSPTTQTIAVTPVVNATGDRNHDPLARATGELIVAQLSRRGVAVTQGDGTLRLHAKLVLWNGEPTVGLTAVDAAGRVHWSAMARGPADRIAPNVMTKLDEFTATVSDE